MRKQISSKYFSSRFLGLFVSLKTEIKIKRKSPTIIRKLKKIIIYDASSLIRPHTPQPYRSNHFHASPHRAVCSFRLPCSAQPAPILVRRKMGLTWDLLGTHLGLTTYACERRQQFPKDGKSSFEIDRDVPHFLLNLAFSFSAT